MLQNKLKKIYICADLSVNKWQGSNRIQIDFFIEGVIITIEKTIAISVLCWLKAVNILTLIYVSRAANIPGWIFLYEFYINLDVQKISYGRVLFLTKWNILLLLLIKIDLKGYSTPKLKFTKLKKTCHYNPHVVPIP